MVVVIGFDFRWFIFRVKVAVFNAYIQFYPTVLGLWYMRPLEVTKTVTLKNEPPKNEPFKIYDRFTSP